MTHVRHEFPLGTTAGVGPHHRHAQILMDPFLLGDIAGDAEKANHCPLPVADGTDGQLHRQARTVLAQVGPFGRLGMPAPRLGNKHVKPGHRRAEFGAEHGCARGHLFAVVQQRRRCYADQLACGIAKHAFGADAEDLDDTVEVGRDDGKFAGGIDQDGEAVFGLAQGPLHARGQRQRVLAGLAQRA